MPRVPVHIAAPDINPGAARSPLQQQLVDEAGRTHYVNQPTPGLPSNVDLLQGATPPATTDVPAITDVLRSQDTPKEESVGVLGRMGAAFSATNTLGNAIMHDGEVPLDAVKQFPADPHWGREGYWQHKAELDDGLSEDQQKRIMLEADSLQEAQALRGRFLKDNEANAALMKDGAVSGMIYGGVAGLVDPTMLAAVGVANKFERMAAISEALSLSRSTGTAVTATDVLQSASVGQKVLRNVYKDTAIGAAWTTAFAAFADHDVSVWDYFANAALAGVGHGTVGAFRKASAAIKSAPGESAPAVEPVVDNPTTITAEQPLPVEVPQTGPYHVMSESSRKVIEAVQSRGGNMDAAATALEKAAKATSDKAERKAYQSTLAAIRSGTELRSVEPTATLGVGEARPFGSYEERIQYLKDAMNAELYGRVLNDVGASADLATLRASRAFHEQQMLKELADSTVPRQSYPGAVRVLDPRTDGYDTATSMLNLTKHYADAMNLDHAATDPTKEKWKAIAPNGASRGRVTYPDNSQAAQDLQAMIPANGGPIAKHEVLAHEVGHQIAMATTGKWDAGFNLKSAAGRQKLKELRDAADAAFPDKRNPAKLAEAKASGALRHFNKPDEILADVIASVLLGKAHPKVLEGLNIPDIQAVADKFATTGETFQRPTYKWEAPGGVGMLPQDANMVHDHGVDPTGTRKFDPRKLEVFQKVGEWAQQVLAKFPVDQTKVSKVWGGSAMLSSVANQLIRSANDELRALVLAIGEHPGGAGGRNANSVAIDKVNNRHAYETLGLSGYQNAKDEWNKRMGIGFFKKALSTEHSREWDRLLTEEMLSREHTGKSLPTSPKEVVAAADSLYKGYQHMNDDQRAAMVLGYANLPKDSNGYFPRQISAAKWVMASDAERKAFVEKVSENLQQSWGGDLQHPLSAEDKKFLKEAADGAAYQYAERAANSAYGFYQLSSLSDHSNLELLHEVLVKGLQMDTQDVSKLLGILSQSSMKHTKTRLPLDLREVAVTSDGKSFPLYEMFETDQSKLYQTYANRVSGNVAVHRAGIPGRTFFDNLLEKVTTAPDGKRATDSEMKAAKILISEIFGEPVGDRSEVMDAFLMLAGANRMGSSVLPQLGAFIDAHNATSFRTLRDALPWFGKMIKEVHSGKSTDPILKDLDQYTGMLGWDYQNDLNLHDPSVDNRFMAKEKGTLYRIASSAAHANALLSGMRGLLKAQQRMFSRMVCHDLVTLARDADFTGTKGAFKYTHAGGTVSFVKEPNKLVLDMFGSNWEFLRKVHEELPNIAKFDQQGRLTSLSVASTVKHVDMPRQLAIAVRRGTSQILNEAMPGEHAPLHYSPFGRMVTQFRRQALVAMEKQTERQLHLLGVMEFSKTLLMNMVLATPLHLARVYSASLLLPDDQKQEFRDKRLTMQQIVAATSQYSFISGLGSDIEMLMYGTGGLLLHGVHNEEGESIGDKMLAAGNPTGNANSGTFTDNVPLLGYTNTLWKSATNAVQHPIYGAPGLALQLPVLRHWALLPYLNMLNSDFKQALKDEQDQGN